MWSLLMNIPVIFVGSPVPASSLQLNQPCLLQALGEQTRGFSLLLSISGAASQINICSTNVCSDLVHFLLIFALCFNINFNFRPFPQFSNKRQFPSTSWNTLVYDLENYQWFFSVIPEFTLGLSWCKLNQNSSIRINPSRHLLYDLLCCFSNHKGLRFLIKIFCCDLKI